jgi:hypothetical protein
MSSTEPPRPEDSTGSSDPSGAQAPTGGPPQYPHYPDAPQEQWGQQPGPPVEQPSSVRTAVLLMRVGAVVSLLSLVATLLTLSSLKSQIRDQLVSSDRQVSDSMVDAAYGTAIVFSVVLALIGVGLWLWMAWKNGQGRGWARIVATVLGGLNVLLTLISVVSGNATTLALVLSLVNLVLAVVILVLLWKKESSAFFASRRGATVPQY